MRIYRKMPPKKSKATSNAAGAGADVNAKMETLYIELYDAQVKQSGPQSTVFLQVGKFYEMYDNVDVRTGASRTNVQAIAEACGYPVELRPSADPTKHRIFWGFPEASLPKFERAVVNAGYTVRIVSQNKDEAGNVVSRTTDHVSSPGTLYEAEGGLATRRTEQLMLSVYIEPFESEKQRSWQLASSAFDVMTGKSVSTETVVNLVNGKPVLDIIQPFWTVYPPAEVAFYWCSATDPPTESAISAMFPGTAGQRPPIHICKLNPATEGTAATERIRQAFLSEIYKHNSAISLNEYLGLSFYHAARRALYHLLVFIKDHNPSYLTDLHEHTVWTPDDNVLLGNTALEQLAMTPHNSDRPDESLLHWLQKAVTVMGKRAVRERCMRPIADVTELEERQTRIAALRDPAESTAILSELNGMCDLAKLHHAFKLGRAGTNEVVKLVQAYEKVAAALEVSKEKVYGTQDCAELKEYIHSVLSQWSAERICESRKQVSDAISVGSFHPWKRGVHPELDAMEDEWLALEKKMHALKAEYEDVLGCKKEAIELILREDEPFIFQLTKTRAGLLAKHQKQYRGISVEIVNASSTHATIHTDGIRAANAAGAKLRASWKAAIAACWATTWRTWCDATIQSGITETLVEWIGQLDADCAFAQVANLYGYVRPTYVESSEAATAGVELIGLRHPIIERITTTPYIPHNLALGSFARDGAADAVAECGLLLYGVNAAGKSSLGKALGLAVLMAQCGIPVPATAMNLIPYAAIFTRILGNDNLWAGMSSFVVEMTEFRSILRSAGPRTLVIGDELCAGTETASAVSIVAAGIETLVSRKCNFFFATHLHELARIPDIAANSNIASYHLSVHSDTQRGCLVYDRKLRPGCGSPMYGLEVCRGLDMDASFLAAAFKYRKTLFEDGRDPRVSRYNAAVVVQACGVCGSKRALETHHIVPQAAADEANQIAPGKHKNTQENLVVLCSECHDAYHGGMLDIQGWVQTTHGRQLQFKHVY